MTWPWIVVAWYGAWSIAAFIVFAWDKVRARSGGWRVPERTLHTLTLIGGVAGSIAAMVLLRHKTRKFAFVGVGALAVAVAAHLGAWVFIALR